MRIVSKFKDYYDSSAGFGVDMTQVFLRKQETHVLHEIAKEPSFAALEKELTKAVGKIRHLNSESYSPVIVGFCGKLYIGLKAPNFLEDGKYEYSGSGMDREVVKRIYWHASEFPQQLLHKKVDNFSLAVFLRRQFNSVGCVAEWFEVNEKALVHECPVAFANAGQAIFYHEPYGYGLNGKVHIMLNPCLLEHGFQRVKDPFSAFQEISMFLGGVLSAAENSIVTLSDRDRSVAHGFDEKSFRKEATKRTRS